MWVQCVHDDRGDDMTTGDAASPQCQLGRPESDDWRLALPSRSDRRSQRINLRVEPEVDEYLRHAASLAHKSLSAFMLDAACEHARNIVEEQRRIELSAAEFTRVLDELDRPAEVVEPMLKLVERAARRSQLVSQA